MKLIVNRIVSEFNKIFNGTKRVGDSLKLEGRRMSSLDVANASTLGYKTESSLNVKSAISSDKTITLQSFNILGNPNTDSNGNPVYVKEHQLRVANAQKLNDVSAINLEVDISRRLKVGDQPDSPIINVSSLVVNPTLFRVKDSMLLGGKLETELYVSQSKLADNATLLNNKAASALVVEKSRIATKLLSDDGLSELTESGLRVSSSQYIRKGQENLDIYGIRDYLFATDQAKAVLVTTASSSNTLTTATGNKSFTDILSYLKTDISAEIYKASHLITGSGASLSVKTGDEIKTWIIDHADFSTKVGTLNANTAGRAVRIGDATGTTYNITELLDKIPTIKVSNSTLSDNSTKLQNNTPDDIVATTRNRILTDASNITTGLTQGEVDGFFGNTKVQTKVKGIKVDNAINADTLGTKTLSTIMQDVKDAGQVSTARYIYADPTSGGQKSYLDITADITKAKADITGTATASGNTLAKLETIISTNKTNIETSLATEVTNRTNQGTTLQVNINTEKSRIDSILSGADDDKNTFAEIKTYILSLTGDLTTETTPLANGVNLNLVNIANALETRIAEVESSATTSTGNLGGEVNNIETAVGLNGLGKLSTVTGNYISGATSVMNSIDRLDTALKTEETARINGDTNVLTKIGALPTLNTSAKIDVVSSINELVTTITTETNRAKGVEGTLVSLTTTAKGSLVSALNELKSDLTNEITNRGNNEGSLGGLTTTVTSSLVAAINSLKTELNSEITTRSNNVGTLASLNTAAKGSLVLAINELKTTISTETNRASITEGTLTNLTTSTNSSLVAAINELNTTISAETNRAKGVEGNLTGYVLSKVNLTAAINSLNTTLSNETTRAIGVEGTLASLTTTAKGSLVSALNELKVDLTNEISNRTSADGVLQTNINTISNSMGWVLNASGKINITDTNHLNVTDGTVLDIFKKVDTQISSDFNNLDVRVINLVGEIATEKGRIDSILNASSADKDSFKEIVDLINSVDTTNDESFAGYVLSNDARSTTIESNVSTLTSDVSNVTGRTATIEGDISTLNDYVITNDARSTTIEGDISTLNDYVITNDARSTTIEGDISTLNDYVITNDARSTTIEGDVSNVTDRTATLESLKPIYHTTSIIIEDDGSNNTKTSYIIPGIIIDDSNSIVFSNGLKMRKTVHYSFSNDGTDTTLTILMVDRFPLGEFIDIETISLG